MRIFFLYLSLFIAKVGFGQQHFALQNFSAFTKDTHVVLQWTMKQGNTCFGTGILRSDDNINFTEVGLITGICGSVDAPVSFTFIDSFPIKNRTAYYKLVLGILGESESIQVIYYDLQRDNFIVIPNPANGNGSRIIFSNEPQELSKILFFDDKGRLLYTSPLTLGNYFYIPTNEPQELSKILFYDAKGRLLYTSPLTLGNYFYIPTNELPYIQSGLISFSVLNVKGEIISSGSFVYLP